MLTEYSITQIEKSCESLKRKLEKKGYKVSLDVFKSGSTYWGDTNPSYVKVTVTHPEWGDTNYKRNFVSGGYAVFNSWEIATDDGLKVAKNIFFEGLNKKEKQMK